MEGGSHQVVLSEVERALDLKVLTQYLTVTKAMQTISKVTWANDRFLLNFNTHKDAESFIKERAFRDQIIQRKLNIYPAAFEDEDAQLEMYTINGLNKDNLRMCFEACWAYANCRFALKDQEKKAIKGTVQFMLPIREEGWREMTARLKEFDVTLAEMEKKAEDFMCSIQLINFDKIEHTQMDEIERVRLQASVKTFMLKISEKELKNVEVKVFLHQGSPMVKAYLRYGSAEDTLEAFEKVRLYLLEFPPQTKCRLYYYSKEANSFRTLFTNGLQIPENTTEKQFQQQLIEDFRKITPGVVQVLLRDCRNMWTGKIYLKDEASGKQLASEYLQKRVLIYKHYRDKGKIMVNLFQDKQALTHVRKIETNAGRMLEHIRSTHEREKQMIPVVLHQPYVQRPTASRKQQRFRERESKPQPQVSDKREGKVRYKPKQEQFPSL